MTRGFRHDDKRGRIFAAFNLAAEDFPLPARVPRVTQPFTSLNITDLCDFTKVNFPVCCNLAGERKLRAENDSSVDLMAFRLGGSADPPRKPPFLKDEG